MVSYATVLFGHGQLVWMVVIRGNLTSYVCLHGKRRRYIRFQFCVSFKLWESKLDFLPYWSPFPRVLSSFYFAPLRGCYYCWLVSCCLVASPSPSGPFGSSSTTTRHYFTLANFFFLVRRSLLLGTRKPPAKCRKMIRALRNGSDKQSAIIFGRVEFRTLE